MDDTGTYRLRRFADQRVEQRGGLSQVPGTRVQARELEPRGCTEGRTVRRMFEMPAGAAVIVQKLQRETGVVLDLRVVAHACGGRGQVLDGFFGTLQLQRQAANRHV